MRTASCADAGDHDSVGSDQPGDEEEVDEETPDDDGGGDRKSRAGAPQVPDSAWRSASALCTLLLLFPPLVARKFLVHSCAQVFSDTVTGVANHPVSEACQVLDFNAL